jgi:hypothetical protein
MFRARAIPRSPGIFTTTLSSFQPRKVVLVQFSLVYPSALSSHFRTHESACIILRCFIASITCKHNSVVCFIFSSRKPVTDCVTFFFAHVGVTESVNDIHKRSDISSFPLFSCLKYYRKLAQQPSTWHW